MFSCRYFVFLILAVSMGLFVSLNPAQSDNPVSKSDGRVS
jgi:hypothetical protein